ncbi:MAG: response regulator [Deltaproteobacteria bacterium]|nr:response regulator [Deltaproteobacteria bacterium]OQX66173.1 MAG: hypothetical protein B5M55_00840 [Desulfococcus sp. 4484_242]
MNRILVVDEDAAILLLYTDELGEEGYEVVTGNAGSELMELIAEKRPDVVILDAPADDPEGLGLCHDIRKSYEDLPVILSGLYASRRLHIDPAVGEPCGAMSSDLRELKRAIQRAVAARRQCVQGPFFVTARTST